MVRSVAINVCFNGDNDDDGNDYMMMTVMTFDGLQDCGRNPAEDTNLAPLAPA